MIKKTITISALLFVIYSVFVTWFAPKWWTATQNQWQDNIVKAQKYLYNETDCDANVIIGSSLSCRIVIDSLPQTCNLSFNGQSIFDGLNIVARAKKSPERVFIETNIVLRPEDKKFTSSLNSILYYPRKMLLSLRDDKQPIAIIGPEIRYKITGRIINHVKSLFGINGANTEDKEFFSKMLKLQSGQYATLPGDSLLNASFDNLELYLTELQKKNIKITFFEMPVNKQLVNSPLASLVRETFYKRFPVSKYEYIGPPVDEEFVTTDGVHLTADEALRYTMYLKAKMVNSIQ